MIRELYPIEKIFKVSYNKEEDIIYLGGEEKIKFSIDLALPSGDAVVDIGYDSQIKGIEIYNATKFFPSMQKELENIKNAIIRIIYTPSYSSLFISLNLKKETSFTNLIIPYSKELVIQ